MSRSGDAVNEILLVGHSRGAAVATVCSAELAVLYACEGIVVSLVTFASPRVGDTHFKRFCDGLVTKGFLRVARFVHKDDIVKWVPLEATGPLATVQSALLAKGGATDSVHVGNAVSLGLGLGLPLHDHDQAVYGIN